MSTTLSLADLETNDARAPQGRRERRFLCPLCGDGKPRDAAHRSLAVNTHTGAWHCHRCGARGLLKDKWTERAPQSRRERTRAAVARAFALPRRKDAPEADDATESKWRAWWEAAQPLINSGGNSGAAYVEGRGISPDVASRAGVRFSAEFYRRPAVLFAVHDRTGALVAVSGRFVEGEANRKTQTAGRKSNGVFATPGALSSPVVAVCEAPLDALSLWLCGIPAVAMIGTSAPDWLASALAFRAVLLATDADTGGDDAAAKLKPEIEARGARTLRLRPCGVKDWNEVLGRRSAIVLQTHLAPFAAGQHDVTRAMHALDLHHAGRADAARFVAGLIPAAELRENVRAKLRMPAGAVQGLGALPDEICIPADLPNDEESIRRCIDVQRLPVMDVQSRFIRTFGATG